MADETRKWLNGGLVTALLIGVTLLATCVGGGGAAVPTPTPVPTATPTPVVGNLYNPGFEEGVDQGRVHVVDGIFHDNIMTPDGWVTWWDVGGCEGGQWGQPEVAMTTGDDLIRGYEAELPRLWSGNQAVRFLVPWRPWDAGLYQRVTELRPGEVVTVTAMASAWTCDGSGPVGYTCVGEWDQIYFRLGIEPDGLLDPLRSTIVWSEPQIAPDDFELIGPVSARVGASGEVLIVLRATARWGFANVDAHFDEVLMERSGR